MALRVIDSLVLRSEPVILLLGRICIGSLYLMSGINHWRDLALLTHDDPRLRRYWLYGLSPEGKASIDGRVIHDHQV
jgi:hypothetical protein